MPSARSPILVDHVLDFEIKGDHIHITDAGGGVHLAMSRGCFFANIRRAGAVAAMLAMPPDNIVHVEKRGQG